jgi:type IV pilus assembly protein PilV
MKNYLTKRHSGFSMIEVLVAVLVLAIGLLGVAAIQTTALKNNNSALQRSQANMLAYFMMDAMRANSGEANKGSYNLTKTCVVPVGSNLITRDQNAWLTALKANLGNVSTTCGEIDCTTSSCKVKVYWDDSHGSIGSNGQNVGITDQFIVISSRL